MESRRQEEQEFKVIISTNAHSVVQESSLGARLRFREGRSPGPEQRVSYGPSAGWWVDYSTGLNIALNYRMALFLPSFFFCSKEKPPTPLPSFPASILILHACDHSVYTYLYSISRASFQASILL